MSEEIPGGYDLIAKYYPAIFQLQNPDSDIEGELDFIQSLLSLHRISVKSVVDIGSGMGRLIDAMKRRGFNSVGIDGSEAMLELARNEYPDSTFLLSRFEDFEVGADLGVCWWTTYNYLDPAQFSRFASNLSKRVDHVLLDSSNYPADIRPTRSRKSIVFKGIEVEQDRTWSRDGDVRRINYHYVIRSGTVVERISYTDVSYWYPLEILVNHLDRKFRLLGSYGDYSTDSNYSVDSSPRLVTLWERNR